MVYRLRGGEHLPLTFAEIVGKEGVPLALQEACHQAPHETSRDTTFEKNLAEFVVALCDSYPREAAPLAPVIATLFDSTSHILRSGAVSALGILCRDLPDLWGVIIERGRDISSFTRSRTLQVWKDLVDAGQLPLIRLLPLTTAAVARLADKAVAVRKNAVSVVLSLIEHNPFSRTLKLSDFEKKLKECREITDVC